MAKIVVAPKPYEGRIIKLYGSEEYNVFEMSEILSDLLAKKIKYDPVSIGRFKELDTQRGDDVYFIQHVTHVAQDCIDAVFAGTNDCV